MANLIYACEGCVHGEHDSNCRENPANQRTPKTRVWHNTDGRSVISDDNSLVSLWFIELGYVAWLGIDRPGSVLKDIPSLRVL